MSFIVDVGSIKIVVISPVIDVWSWKPIVVALIIQPVDSESLIPISSAEDAIGLTVADVGEEEGTKGNDGFHS